MRALGPLACLCLLLGCTDGANYRIVVRFEPEDLLSRAHRLELSLVGSCRDQAPTGAPADRVIAGPVEVPRGTSAAPFGELDVEGPIQVYARVRDASCRVIAAGCQPVTLVSGQGARVVVVARPVSGFRTCATGFVCSDGRCLRDGVIDGGADGTVDATVPRCEPDECDIDGRCVASGELIPDSRECASCEPTLDATDWTPGCIIDDDCVPAFGRSQFNDCLECNPARDLDDWSERETASDCRRDGIHGRCFPDGVDFECCTGCVDIGEKECRRGVFSSQCGRGGEACAECSGSEFCLDGECMRP